MGDVGSLALGGSDGRGRGADQAGIAAGLHRRRVTSWKALSVILQVGSYKLRGKRIFKMAPLHHHFEALGWQESKIIIALLDRRPGDGAVRADDTETAMKHELKGRTVLVAGMGKSGVAADGVAAEPRMRSFVAADERPMDNVLPQTEETFTAPI